MKIALILVAVILPMVEVNSSSSCDFESGTCYWRQSDSDQFDWTRHKGETPTQKTGPSSTTSSGYYMFVETTGLNDGDTANLISSTPGCALQISYNMNGKTIGLLSVSSSISASGPWTEEWSVSGAQGNTGFSGRDWYVRRIAWGSNSRYVMISASRGGYSGDIAIDNTTIFGCTATPTNAPTAVGETNAPTAMPTPVPTLSEVQMMFAGMPTQDDKVNFNRKFNFTYDADWGGRELVIPVDNMVLTLRGEGENLITLDAKVGRFVSNNLTHLISSSCVPLNSPSIKVDSFSSIAKETDGQNGGNCRLTLESSVLENNRVFATFANNNMKYARARGGAIFMSGVNANIPLNGGIDMQNVLLKGNSAVSENLNKNILLDDALAEGGALFLNTVGSWVRGFSCEFVANFAIAINNAINNANSSTATARGGGLYVRASDSPTTLENPTFNGNFVSVTGAAARLKGAGAIHSPESDVNLRQFAFSSLTDDIQSSRRNLSCYGGYFTKREIVSPIGACTLCPAGKFIGPAQTTCAECVSCPPGMHGNPHQPRDGLFHQCTFCPRGYFSEKAGGMTCSACLAGRYGASRGESTHNCTAECPKSLGCPPGTSSPVIITPGSAYIRNGTRLDETECPANNFCVGGNKFACPVGKYQQNTGKAFCEPVEKGTVLRPVQQNGLDVLHPWTCVEGMTCDGNTTGRSYDGGYWHNPREDFPKTLYVCVNEGCPDKGASKMECKKGYEPLAPLCAVCAPGYFTQLRKCVECKDPLIAAFVLFTLGLLALVVGAIYLFRRHSKFLTGEVLANAKIVVSFFTIVSTVDVQFGIRWPEVFLELIAVLSSFTFDLSILSGVFCLVKFKTMFQVSYFLNLVCSTFVLVFIVAILYLMSILQPQNKQIDGRSIWFKSSIYLLLFAYPVVSLKVTQAFGCQDVDGVHYLRADYNVECYTSDWWPIAAYATVFLVLYVICAPLLVLATLWQYRKQVESVHPTNLLLGFLLDDYKCMAPCLMWDGFEMLRKLIASCVGVFWSSQSPMAIATAFVLSLFFMMVHMHYQPYKSAGCNRVQLSCLTTISIIYFAGLLLKLEAVEKADRDGLGNFLVVLVAGIFCVVFFAVGQVVVTVFKAAKRARHCGIMLQRLPQEDPPEGSPAFYKIQIPVEESNMGEKFIPKQPHDLAHLLPQNKLKVVRLLSDENEPLLLDFFQRLQHDWTNPLVRVAKAIDVTFGKFQVKHSRKTDQSILSKACRPAIRALHPDFSVEHIRDTLRFKAVVYSFRDVLHFIYAMDNDRGVKGLFSQGITKDNIVKLDITKLREPKEWGWRFVAFDFIMANHQIVECYIVFTEMEDVKKHDDPGATRCPHMSNHDIFDKWRVRDTSQFDGDTLEEFLSDKEESNRRYDEAFAHVLSHTSELELLEFWKPFGITDENIYGSLKWHSTYNQKSGLGSIPDFVKKVLRDKLLLESPAEFGDIQRLSMRERVRRSVIEQAEDDHDTKGSLISLMRRPKARRATKPYISTLKFDDGNYLCKQGDEVDENSHIYILKRGHVRIIIDGVEVATRADTYVGEGAILGTERSADVVAAGYVECTAMDKQTFKNLSRELWSDNLNITNPLVNPFVGDRRLTSRISMDSANIISRTTDEEQVTAV